MSENGALSPHLAKTKARLGRSMSSAQDLLGIAQRQVPDPRFARQEHENDAATTVIVCEPERATIMMGGLHPRASLFEKTVHLDHAISQHAAFREALQSHGLQVRLV